MLRRWLVALKEVERFYGSVVDQVGIEKNAGLNASSGSKDSPPKRPVMVSNYQYIDAYRLLLFEVFLLSAKDLVNKSILGNYSIGFLAQNMFHISFGDILSLIFLVQVLFFL